MIQPKKFLMCFYKAGYNTVYHDGIEHAGYLAFLMMLAIFPFLVFTFAIAGVIGTGQAGNEFISFVFSKLPNHMVRALDPRVKEIVSGPPQGLLTISILGAIWTASSAVEGYRTVLNRAYHVSTPPAYIWRRLMSVVQLLVLSFIVVMCTILLVVIPLMWHKIESLFGMDFTSADKLNLGSNLTYIGLAIIFGVITAMYYVLPNIKQRWYTVVPGALVASLGWLWAANLFSSYLQNFDQVNLIYGSLGGIIAALLFFYIINVIFIYGAELNYMFIKAVGDIIVQKEDAGPKPPQKEYMS